MFIVLAGCVCAGASYLGTKLGGSSMAIAVAVSVGAALAGLFAINAVFSLGRHGKGGTAHGGESAGEGR